MSAERAREWLKSRGLLSGDPACATRDAESLAEMFVVRQSADEPELWGIGSTGIDGQWRWHCPGSRVWAVTTAAHFNGNSMFADNYEARPLKGSEPYAGAYEQLLANRNAIAERLDAAEAKLNTPELHDFAKAVVLEAAHQRDRWGSDHDAGKTPADWFWLVGYLAGKALHAIVEGQRATGAPTEKALHHIITTAAVLANWHAEVEGTHTRMRPGIEPPKEPG